MLKFVRRSKIEFEYTQNVLDAVKNLETTESLKRQNVELSDKTKLLTSKLNECKQDYSKG